MEGNKPPLDLEGLLLVSLLAGAESDRDWAWSVLVTHPLLAKKVEAPFKPKLADKFDASNFEGEESGELDLVKLVDTDTDVFIDF